MRALIPLLRLDLVLQARSFLYPATAVSTLMICVFIMLLPERPASPEFVAFLVFMDPATIGLSFVGAMVLVEKSQGTLFALGLTPARPAAYVSAKAISLTLLTFVSSLVVVLVATAGAFDLARQLVALTLCSVVAVLMGLVCVTRARGMNQLVVTLLGVTTLLYVPLLAHFGVLGGAPGVAVALIPSYAMLTALQASVDPGTVSPVGQGGAVAYLVVWAAALWRGTMREFERSIVTEGR